MYFIYIDIDALQFVFLFVFAFVFVFVFVFARSKLWGEGMYSGRVVADFRCLISKQLQTPPHPPCLASGRNWFYFGWKTLNCSIVWCYGQCIVIAMDGEWSLKPVARDWGQIFFVQFDFYSNLNPCLTLDRRLVWTWLGFGWEPAFGFGFGLDWIWIWIWMRAWFWIWFWIWIWMRAWLVWTWLGFGWEPAFGVSASKKAASSKFRTTATAALIPNIIVIIIIIIINH